MGPLSMAVTRSPRLISCQVQPPGEAPGGSTASRPGRRVAFCSSGVRGSGWLRPASGRTARRFSGMRSRGMPMGQAEAFAAQAQAEERAFRIGEKDMQAGRCGESPRSRPVRRQASSSTGRSGAENRIAACPRWCRAFREGAARSAPVRDGGHQRAQAIASGRSPREPPAGKPRPEKDSRDRSKRRLSSSREPGCPIEKG